MDWVSATRLFTAVALGLAVLDYGLMLVYYCQRVLPLRKKISDGEILAPPAGWSLLFHIVVFCWLLLTIVATFQSMARHTEPTFMTYVAPPLSVATLIAVGKFLNYYSRNLRHAERKREGPTFPAV